MFVVSKDSEYFYSSDGVLFTDYPVKTLVRFPNNWQIEELSAYQIPEGTEVIAPWAFSGIHTLGYLHIPESVHTIGDYAFAEAEVYYMLRIYATDSVTTIGKDLFKKIKGYTEIYANPDSAIWQYAQKNRIDCKEYISYQPREKTITTGEPDLTEAEDPWGPGRKKRVILPVFGSDYIGDTLQLYYDLTELQEMEHDEVYIPVGNRWPDILPDKNGKTNNGYPASEGLFGVGYTEGVTILRGYDQEGEICGVRQAEGDFTFALPGAVTIGVSGGKGTHLSLVPYQPVYVEKPGTLPLTEDVFRQSTRMHPFQILLLDYPSPHWSIKCPEHLNVVTAITADAFGMTSNEATGRKTILTLSVKDTYLADQLDQVSFHFHSADRTLENGQLTFALLKDKSGYEITQCSEDAVVAVIPATYEGLPVKSIANRAFVNCPLLEEYTVTDDSDLYYTEDGVLFTDEPVRTLVRFPNHWRGERINAYMVPEGTKAIAPWAFSGNNDSLTDLHIPEGVTTLGDCAFAESVLYASLYAPDSLTKIGKKLTQNMKGSVAVYANKGAAALKYASSQHIPCNSYTEQDVPEKTVQIGEADLTDAGNLNPPDPDRRAVYEIEDDLRFFLSAMQEVYDLTELQQDDPSEVYIPMGRRWPMLQPDAEGKTADGYIPQEGVYGVGYTNGEATLRGYDAEGNVTGIRRVEGDFVFALPGAVDFGVSGGDGTRLSIIPYEPVVITGPGSLPLSPEEFRSGENGMPFLAYALAYDYPVASASFPSYLNTLSSCPTDAFGTPFGTSGHYVLLVKQMNDPYLMDRMNEYALVFHTLEKQFENKEITVRASTQYAGDMDEDLGNKIWG